MIEADALPVFLERKRGRSIRAPTIVIEADADEAGRERDRELAAHLPNGRIVHVERDIDDRTYHIRTKKLHVSQLGDVKLAIAEKETDEDEENPVEYLATNGIDAPTQHVSRFYGMR